jgi:hypothetical protein
VDRDREHLMGEGRKKAKVPGKWERRYSDE